jgi:hypothetical protein
MKLRIFLLLALLFLPVGISQPGRVHAAPDQPPVRQPGGTFADAYGLIDQVNALRAANGLPGYSINTILMSIAQQHAEYMAANGVSHYGYGGTRPYQRALNAGYPVGGDLSLGGFFSENITAGVNKTPLQAVQEWQGDAPHLNTMLSGNLTEIGAGAAQVGDYIYYVIDCSRPSGSSAPQTTSVPAPTLPGGTPGSTYTPEVVAGPLASTILPSTPDSDGKLFHIVQPGETLWLIAISYGVKVAEIRKLNNLAENANIYPQTKLLVKIVPLPTATSTITPTAPPTYTPVPTWTALPSPTLTVTPLPKVAVAPQNASLPILGAIVLTALLLAGFLTASARIRR